MWSIGPIGFTVPWLLAALILLPILWILLRAVPPAPIRRRFPGVALLLGLQDDEQQTDKTPWWLLLLRMLAIGAAIVGFAGPVLNPERAEDGTGPLLVLIDGTWADAPDWSRRMDRAEAVLTDARDGGRQTALVVLTDPPAEGALTLRAADAWIGELPSIEPVSWLPDAQALEDWAETLDGSFDTFWLSDGLGWEGRTALLETLEARGAVSVFETPRPVFGLRPAVWDDGEIAIEAVRSRPDLPVASQTPFHVPRSDQPASIGTT